MKPHLDGADLDLIAIVERDGVDGSAIDDGAVGAAEVVEMPATLFLAELGVVAGDDRVVEHDSTVVHAAQQDHRVGQFDFLAEVIARDEND